MISKKEIELRYVDADSMGIIHHSIYLQYFEIGRLDLLELYGFNYYDIEDSGILFPIREVNITYLKSIRPSERIVVETKVHYITKVKTTFYHEIKNLEGELKCTGYSTIVFVDKDTFKLQKLDVKIPKLYEQMKRSVS